MRSRTRLPVLTLAWTALLLGGSVGCQEAPELHPGWLEGPSEGQTFQTKPLGINGQVDYCGWGPASLCVQGEGDCDANIQCAGALRCGDDNGPQFGMWVGIDVCVPRTCTNGVLDPGEIGVDCDNDLDGCGVCTTCPMYPNGDPQHCDTLCPCPAGEGDCDSDGDCAGSLVCVTGIGQRFGLSAGVDVCLPPSCENGVVDADEGGIDCGGTSACGPCPTCAPNNLPNTCDPWECVCDQGEGDCDSDAECAAGLVCPQDAPNGSQFPEIYRDYAVCVPPHCTNGQLDEADGEMAVDCGAACGTDCVIPPRKAFVTSTYVHGDFGGVASGDTICNDLATQAGLPGTYMAWLSDAQTSPSTRFTSNGPWELVNGTPIASDLADLLDGSLLGTLDRDESNQLVDHHTAVWTGTNSDGTWSGNDCNGWTSDLRGVSVDAGDLEADDTDWTNASWFVCWVRSRLYCFQQ